MILLRSPERPSALTPRRQKEDRWRKQLDKRKRGGLNLCPDLTYPVHFTLTRSAIKPLKTILSLIVGCIYLTLSVFQAQAEGMETDTGRVIVRQITVIGNQKTREYIILRELTFTVGDTLPTDRLTAIFTRNEDNLFNTHLFNSTEIRSLRDGQEIRVFIMLKERWYIFPIPIVEVAERNFNTWWQTKDFSRLIYGMAIDWRNVTGRNDVFTSTIRLGYVQRLSFNYSRPYIDKARKIGLTVGSYYLRNREIQIMTRDNQPVFFSDNELYNRKEYGGTLGFSYRPELYQTHSLEGYYRHAATTDTAIKLNPDFFSPGDSTERFFSLRYLYKSNHLDISVYPLKGYYWDAEVNKNGFRLLGDDIHILSLTARARKFWALAPRWFAAASFTGKVSDKSFQPYFNTRALGYGRDIIRGYEYYVLDGQHFGLFKTGLRFAILPQKEVHAGFVPSSKFNTIPFSLYAGIYFDAGYVYDHQFEKYNPLVNQWQFGYGAGLDLFTYYDVVLRLEYSFNRMGESGLFLHFTSAI